MVKHAARRRNVRNDLAHTEDLFGWSSQCNVARHDAFFDTFVVAIERAGVPRAEVARRLGISSDELEVVISGQTDMTLTELRMLSSASELVIDFHVEAAAVEQSRMSRQHLSDLIFVVHESANRGVSWENDTKDMVAVVQAKVASS
ncbi:hypothetical protein [Microbacterium sp. K36]|uniref:hypothetical protein n=1 Tax=Microbacterium sp. K36 TaxID=2305439 RepID=UPI00109C4FD9|nr:hypothetical protein [Microbacterium sp. K36]